MGCAEIVVYDNMEKVQRRKSHRNVLLDYITHVNYEIRIKQNFLFMPDCHPKHTSLITESAISSAEVPAKSPDINSVEYLWAIPKRRVSYRVISNNKQNLKITLREEWTDIPFSIISKLDFVVL